MRTLEHFHGIGKHLDGIESRLNALSYAYQEVAPRGPLDDALIIAFRTKAAELSAAAEALLAIAYDPTPPPASPELPPAEPEGGV
jgi:hypothetical protein